MCCRHFSTMHLLFGCIMLIVTTEVTSSLSNTQNDSIKMQDILHETEDSLFQNEFDSNSFQEKSKKEMRTFDIVFDYIVREITSISNFPTLVARNISEQCRNDTRDFRAAKFKFTDWAMKMYESTGKWVEEMAGSHNRHVTGSFEECLSIEVNWTETSFQGQYCTVFLEEDIVSPEELDDENLQVEDQEPNGILRYLFSQHHGPKLKKPKVSNTEPSSRGLPSVDFCIPSSCSVEDFRSAIAQLVGSGTIGNITSEEGVVYHTSIVTKTDDKYCYTKKKVAAAPEFDGPDIAVMITLGLLALLILMATSRDLWLVCAGRRFPSEQGGLVIKSLHCFSLLENNQKLLSTKSAAVNNLACLDGIRVLSTTWIVLYHSYYVLTLNPMINVNSFIQEYLTWSFHGAMNATLAVDTFFVMGGLLVTHSLMRELDRNSGRFNVGFFYLHRYLRLTPVYGVILGFIATLLVYLGSGPNWQNVREMSVACRWNWWSNLFYINNIYFPYSEACMGETWYLACEMKMFLLSPLFIYPLWRWRKVGMSITFVTIFALLCVTLAISIIFELPAMGFFTRDIGNPYYLSQYYVRLWTRFPPYLLGIFLGWTLNLIGKKERFVMGKIAVTTGWIIAACVGLAVLYGMAPYVDPSVDMNNAVRFSYATFHRFGWALFVSWVIFACVNGYGGFVNQFLSWKVFVPLGRLTYVVYLIHQNYLIVYHANLRKPYFYNKTTHTQHYFGVFFIVFLMAYAICLTVEVPLLNLERLLITSNSIKRKTVRAAENSSGQSPSSDTVIVGSEMTPI